MSIAVTRIVFGCCAAICLASGRPAAAEPLTWPELRREAVTLRSSVGEAVLLLGEVLARRAPATLAGVEADETASLLEAMLAALTPQAIPQCEASRQALRHAAEGARDAFTRLGGVPDRPDSAPALRDEFGRLRDAVMSVRPCDG